MSDKKPVLVVHACGGAGINISDKSFVPLMNLGDGFANVIINYIDTSDANYKAIDAKNDLWFIKPHAHSKNFVAGSGGDRAANAEDINKDIPNYLDTKGYKQIKNDEFHVVVFASNGGSGSVIGPVVYKNLIKAGIPAFVVMVGDRKNFVYANHTVNTFATLDNMAKQIKSACGILYYNNTDADPDDNNIAEQKVNNAITNTMMGILAFIGGEVESIDYKDMVNFFCMEQYKNVIPIKPGIYGIALVQGTPNVPKDSIPMVARSISNRVISSNLDFVTYHQKQGIITNDNIMVKYEKYIPLHLIQYGNVFQASIDQMRELANVQRERLNNMETIKHGGADESYETEDGLIL